jgi:acyl carrier protein
MIDRSTTLQKVREYVINSTYTDKINDDTLIFKEGLFDSMGFVSLITYLENEFKITTQNQDLVEENFESINSIASYVLRK